MGFHFPGRLLATGVGLQYLDISDLGWTVSLVPVVSRLSE